MIRLLLDEHISPVLVARLGDHGVYAQSVPHVGLSGRPDPEIWKYALDHDFAVITTNARDFVKLLVEEVHPGLIVFRQSGLTREEQWQTLLPVIQHLEASGGDNFLLNKLIEITAPGQWEIREIPAS